MANVVFTNLTKDAWTKVATNVTSGTIHHVKNSNAVVLQASVDTGDAAPTLVSEGVRAFTESRFGLREVIASSKSIDVYLFTVAENVRVGVDAT